MPVTLAEAEVGVQDALDARVINEFRKSSYLLDRLTFDQAVTPAGRGATLTYSYIRATAESRAQFRAINTEYTPTEVTKTQYSVGLKPLGGSFQIDRVLSRVGVVDEVQFQMDAKIAATRARFAYEVINGDSAVDQDGFDGLSKALTGSTTEVTAAQSWLAVDSQLKALQAASEINAWLYKLDGTPDAIFANAQASALLGMIAALSGQQRAAQDAFGRPLDSYRGIPIIDLGARDGSADPVIPIGTNEVQHIAITGSPTGGTFTITWGGQTTAPIAYNATAAAVESALEALSNIDLGDVKVSGGPLPGTAVDVTFMGRYAATNVASMTTADSLTGGSTPASAVTTPTAGAATGKTDIYAVRFGLDGFHAVAVTGPLVKTWLPDFTTAGAVKTGEVEMGPVAPVLKASRAAGVLRGVTVSS